MNSRRLMGLPKAKDRGSTIADQGRASQQKRPLNVRFGSGADITRTSSDTSGMSALCQKRTYAVQQRTTTQ